MCEMSGLEGSAPTMSDGPATAADLLAQAEQLTVDLQRERADFTNYRRRTEAERADVMRSAKQELLVRLLEVVDDLDRALDSVTTDLAGQSWLEGVRHVERKLGALLAAEGLVETGAAGEPFDPYVHEAVDHVVSTTPEGAVVDVIRKAYTMHGRVIRPALVTVSKGGS